MVTRRLVMFFALLFCLISTVCLGMRVVEYYSLPEELRWSSEKINETPENTVVFLRARIKHIADRLDPTTRNPMLKNTRAKKWLQTFLASQELEKGLTIIEQGKEMATKQKLRLTLIPDEHADAVQGTQSDSATQRQREIADYVNKHRFPVIFTEGMDFDLNWENLYSGLKTAAARSDIEFPFSFEEFKTLHREHEMKAWWDDFLGKESPKIIGIDRNVDTQLAILLLANLNCQEVSTQECVNTAQWMNYNYRSKFILATVILEMEQRGLQGGVLVLGSAHIEPLTAICKEWGVELRIE